MCRCATVLCFSWGTLSTVFHWTEFSQNFSCLLGTRTVYRTSMRHLSFIDLPILGAVLISPLQRRSICALGMKFFCPFNRADIWYLDMRKMVWDLYEDEQIVPAPASSVVLIPISGFRVPALSSSDTLKRTPCHIANNIMQMIPNTEDSRNLMQICLSVGNCTAARQFQQNVPEPRRECVSSQLRVSNTNNIPGTYSNWNLWDIINLSANECGFIQDLWWGPWTVISISTDKRQSDFLPQKTNTKSPQSLRNIFFRCTELKQGNQNGHGCSLNALGSDGAVLSWNEKWNLWE